MNPLKNLTILFLVLLSVSCAVDKVEQDEDQITNPENVWAYDGESVVLKNVIADLKKGEYRESLERRLSKNEVMWKEAKFLLIDGKKRILVPFLSTDKENVIGILALVKDDKGKITFDMTSRTQLKSKSNKLPFWNKGTWMGYFMALDRNILGIKNGNPGLVQRKASEEELSKMFGTATAKSLKTCVERFTGSFYVAFYSTEEQCDAELESTNCYYVTSAVILPVYEEVCWEDDQPAPELPPLPDPVVDNPVYPIHYNNINFSLGGFLGYVKEETYEISSPIIYSNNYEEGCKTNVKIVTNVFTFNIEIDQLRNNNSGTPFYYVNGVSPSPLSFFSFWVDSTNADHWIESYNNYMQNSISIVEYKGENRYKVNGGAMLYSVPVKYKIEINSYTGEILSISRIED
jgi:hypothetical protein